MAEKAPVKTYQYQAELPNIIIEYPENINEDDEDDDTLAEINQPSYPLLQQQPGILHNYNNGHQHFSPSASSSSPRPAQFDVLNGEDEEDSEQTSALLINLPPPTPVPIQRVASEDEFNFCSKRKRAKFVGPYLFGEILGQGSYAKVKECLDRRNLCRRAVKIMQRRRLRKTPHGEKMAATEIRILKKLNHPNVIKLYDFIRNDEKQKLYLFIDLCVVSLQEMLDSDERKKLKINAFPTWQAHGYFVQLIDGLEYLHSKFIIHNDIKPGNLLITIDHQLKITDFGTAEQLDMFSPDDTTKRSQGTPAFQCPEIANADDTYSGFCIDIWSCGVTLYNLVTGQLPFEADNIYLLFQTIGRGIYKIPDDIEPHLVSMLQGLLNVNKNLRFTIEQIKQHDWFRRRPPRTFDYLPFPHLALNRFQIFTMYDYLAELHQPTSEEGDELQQNSLENATTHDGLISVVNPPRYNNNNNIQEEQLHHEEQPPQRSGILSSLNCGCSRTRSSDNIRQEKHRSRHDHRICSVS